MISNKYFWNTLNNLGCIPKKSLRLEFPNENIFKSKDLIRHFIRGYFDGDGCFTRHIYYRTVTPAISILGTPNFLTVLY
jgi:intein/homing endonuclease